MSAFPPEVQAKVDAISKSLEFDIGKMMLPATPELIRRARLRLLQEAIIARNWHLTRLRETGVTKIRSFTRVNEQGVGIRLEFVPPFSADFIVLKLGAIEL